MPAPSLASANVSGLFFVSMDVQDRSGSKLSSISLSTLDARNVVSVENISSLTQNVKVNVSLPNGKRRLAFIDHMGNHDSWSDVRVNIGSGVTVILDMQMRRMGGMNTPAEPIQCDDVEDSVGSLAWASGTSGVPFFITIAAT